MANEANFLRVYIVLSKFLFNWSCTKERREKREVYLKKKEKEKMSESQSTDIRITYQQHLGQPQHRRLLWMQILAMCWDLTGITRR